MESRWVAMESWSFSTVISAQEVGPLLEQQQVLLQLDGVDTYADIIINGEKVAETSNFHRCVPSLHAAISHVDRAMQLATMVSPVLLVAAAGAAVQHQHSIRCIPTCTLHFQPRVPVIAKYKNRSSSCKHADRECSQSPPLNSGSNKLYQSPTLNKLIPVVAPQPASIACFLLLLSRHAGSGPYQSSPI